MRELERQSRDRHGRKVDVSRVRAEAAIAIVVVVDVDADRAGEIVADMVVTAAVVVAADAGKLSTHLPVASKTLGRIHAALFLCMYIL